VPFTFSRDLKDGDERKSIRCKGPKCLEIKHFEPAGGTKKLAMLAYHDSSKVVWMCSTTERGMYLNLEARNYKDVEICQNSLLDDDAECSPLSWYTQ
jgi:hypothetical protein